MDGRKRVLLADSSEEFRWLMWRSAANHNFFSLATVGSGRDVLLCMQKQTADLLLMGMEPTYPSEKYGYIIPKTLDPISDVSTFKEKPDLKTAKSYLTDQAFALGVSHFIPKPFHTDLLFGAMYELFPGCSCGHWPHSPQ